MVKRNRGCVVLIAGLPGSGKTHYAREHLENGIVYRNVEEYLKKL